MKLRQNLLLFVFLAILAVLLLGCTQTNTPGTSPQSVLFGSEFTAQAGGTYLIVNDENRPVLTLEVLSLTDSRCSSLPRSDIAQCVWEGELGANIRVTSDTSLSEPLDLRLGTVRTPSAEAFGSTIWLVSVDPDKNQVRLKTTGVKITPTASQEWFSIDPKKCNSNEWDIYFPTTLNCMGSPACNPNAASQKDKIIQWLTLKYSIYVRGSASKIVSDITCDACTCSTGERIAVLVDSNNSVKMLELGFTDMGLIGCTMEAKLCLGTDVSVGRTAPFCDFEKCPDANADNNSLDLLIQKTNEPGFVANPKEIITSIYSDGNYTIMQTSPATDETNIIKKGNISGPNLAELVSNILATNFFDLNESDTRMCITDIPTVVLDIKIGAKHNHVFGIGAECDTNKLSGARAILELISADTNN